MNIYLIFEWGKQTYQYYVTGDTTGAIVRFILIIGFTLLTAFIVYRDTKNHFNRKKKSEWMCPSCDLYDQVEDDYCQYAGKCTVGTIGCRECKYFKPKGDAK